MYEVEYKVELTGGERESLINLFKERNFTTDGVDQQNDYYIEAKVSPVYKGTGATGYDLKRYRDESGKIIYTEKIWEMVGDTPARMEKEYEVTREFFEPEIKKFPDAIKIKKQREWFRGNSGDIPISITIDSIKFDHSPSVRYFIEAETNTPDIGKVKELKDIIIKFLKEILKKEDIVESPGMFTMAFKKK